ncbi:MAG TPA: pyridine nucleotide-disulfide oxidoreductase [Firmicutes bacterium]|jgi:thioredoxin reductase (NADPH)|nr:pyridine nucleotide-disulfide oxidoreductase [Bacillota bacterium]HAZ21499.1 pyridine nucleotide-disulfide oxidoreductase [Bacillota bacterium]HBG44166.1 pyridine nucleotide-disulfide oxidoreductase [Bacillota bacterium]HBL50031.1 pyridine nucleotide-disulfide oxidoreductase [Bacillota bacterium]HBL68865.1 pyridine nucleotide-disulfide oxidoreductase [Bacillota bacterium]
MDKKIMDYDVVIIGGGAAGLTAAIYCGRARLKTLVIEKSLLGGLATYTNEIENYPGFPEPLNGLDLMKLFEQQAKRFGTEIKLTDVKGIKQLPDHTFMVETFRVDYHAKSVIIATGGKPRLTGAANEENFLYDKGISFCATCDAAYYTDKEVMVIGSGDAAIEEAMFLTKFASRVHVSVIHDEGVMDANKVAQERAMANEKLHLIWNTMVAEFRGEERLNCVVLRHTKTNELIEVPVDGCFLFIGYIPNTEIFKGLVDMTRQGYILTDERMETNIEGLFAAGDVREKGLRQVATCVGDGAIAGVSAEKYIAENEYLDTRVFQNKLPVIAYVWNPTDTTCRELLPALDEIGRIYKDRISIVKIDAYKSAHMVERICDKTQAAPPAIVVLKDSAVQGIYRDCLSLEALQKIAEEFLCGARSLEC